MKDTVLEQSSQHTDRITRLSQISSFTYTSINMCLFLQFAEFLF